MTAEVVLSPCMSICALNDDDICIGCGRTGMEVSYWGRFSNGQKRQALLQASQRRSGKAADCVWQTHYAAAKES